MNASATIYNSVFEGNQDDGLYAAGDASILATNSLLLRNKPFAVRVVDHARSTVMHSVLLPKDTQNAKLGTGVLFDEPQLDKPVEGDPDVRAVDGGKSRVGPGRIAGCEGLL